MSALRSIIETARVEAGSSLGAFTVLSVPVDPYRLDTPANHIVGKWFGEQMARLRLLYRRLHLRGIHYALLGSTAMPTGEPYTNTLEHWEWLQNQAAKAARWLGYVPFDAISDARNEAPVISVHSKEPPDAFVSVEPDIILPDLEDLEPRICITGFEGRQPYRLAFYGEKTSLSPILTPIAARFHADLFLPTGEISDTQLYIMAKTGADDGRRLIVFTLADFDPAGWQMAVSIGRKLQAFRDLLFPNLEFEVRPIALTGDQARRLGLPETPLKDTEKRAAKWREKMGWEQTEIDALATLAPTVLNRIIVEAVELFYDDTLSRRVDDAKEEYRDLAQEALEDQLTDDQIATLRVVAVEKLEEIRAALRDLESTVGMAASSLAVELPEAVVPEPVVDESHQGKPLVSSAWPWIDQTRALIERKAYDGQPNGAGDAP